MAAAIPGMSALVSAKARMALPAELTSHPAALSISARGKAGLPRFSGLKIHQQSRKPMGQTLRDSRRGSRVSRRTGEGNGGIVCESQENAVDVPSVTDATWQSLVLKADGPVLVEFWAPWCGPCRILDPVIGELAKQYTGKLSCFKLNTDDSPSIASQYGVRSIPTIMIFNKGEKKDAVIGAVPKTSLESTIQKFL
ncbi:hypothetical protein SAY87_011668 [Trapa incisa]|uniref:Thioredoxin domain-containing protein n=1 Tax=Trapa incisa TaxID=236973 RepID=A0AAN7JBM2_9MYRT|nr:hypothetical protein SAY87_011668 [Trapa incisa]